MASEQAKQGDVVNRPDSGPLPPNSPRTDSPSPRVSMSGARGNEGTTNTARTNNDAASSLDDGIEGKQHEVPLTKRQKVRRHCGRFKWYYLIAAVVLLAILLPILFKVIIPAIIQNVVNGQKLPVQSGLFRAESPDEITVQLKTSLDTPLPARIDPLTLGLYNRDTKPFTPFVKLNLGTQKVHHKTDVEVPEQKVKVLDEKELVSWLGKVLDQKAVDLSIKADPKPKVNLGALQYRPNMDLKIQLPALDNLRGFGIQSLQFLGDRDANGNNIKGKISLPNHGALTLGLGNLTLNILSGDVKLGEVSVYDVTLVPGDNTKDFDGQLYLDQLLPNLGSILASQQDALSAGQIELNATGKAVMVNGQHIGYLEAILNPKTLSSRMPIMKLVGDVLAGLVNGEGGSFGKVIGEVLGNSTILDGAFDHWEHQKAKNETKTASLSGDGAKEKRSRARRWTMMRTMAKLGARQLTATR